MEFTMSGTGGDITGTGDSDYTADPPDSSLTMSVGGQQMSMLTIGHVMYLQTSQSGKKYLKYDLDDPNNPLGSQLSDQLDPASSMTSFAKAVTAVSSYGRENVGGRKLDHYEMTVDTSKLATGASSGLPADLKADVWFDSEGRLAQLRMDLGAVTYDATLTDFDKAVHLSAPPASQVTEAQPPTGQG
jgi:hypothetical protein